jgi:hypothetical protein
MLSPTWLPLAEQASKETDPAKMIELVEQLSQAIRGPAQQKGPRTMTPRLTKPQTDTGRMARTRKASQRRRRPGKSVRPRTAGRGEVRPTKEEYSVIEEGADPKRGKSGDGEIGDEGTFPSSPKISDGRVPDPADEGRVLPSTLVRNIIDNPQPTANNNHTTIATI